MPIRETNNGKMRQPDSTTIRKLTTTTFKTDVLKH